MKKSNFFLSMAVVAACTHDAKDTSVVDPIFAGLDRPKVVSADALNALFGVPEQLSVPTLEQAFAPAGGSGSGTATSDQRQDSTDFANLTIASRVPQTFVDFIKSETTAAVAKFDRISGYADFKLADALRARKIDVTITDDASKFNNGRWFVGHACGSADCEHLDQCVDKVMVLYDANAWADQLPWLIGAAHHEMFHVGELYLYRQMGKLKIWYSCFKGWHWQEEGFATFGARQMSSDIPYEYPTILRDAFFKWSPITDAAYDRSYEPSALLDRLAQFAGKPVLPFQWVHDASETEAPALGWLRLATGATGEMIDVSVFEGHYLHAAIDTVLPGALGSHTDAIAFAPPSLVPQATLTLGTQALPQRLTSGVYILSTSLFLVSLESWPSDTDKIELKLASDDANASYRALVVAADATLSSCYATFYPPQGDVSKGIQQCFGSNVKVLGALSPTDSVKLASSDLLAYAGSSLYIPVVRLFDNSATVQLKVPANLTLTIDKPNSNPDGSLFTPDSGLDCGPPDSKKLDLASEPNLCPAPGALPTCVCTYPDNYVGYTICSYGSNTDYSNRDYIWPKSDARYWGHEITCAPSTLCELARSCDFDKTKICCSPNDSGTWNIECKFADPAFPAQRTACCHN